MRSFCIILLSIFSLNLLSNNDFYDPNDFNYRQFRDPSENEKKSNEELRSHHNHNQFAQGVSQIPLLNIIAVTAVIGYWGYRSARVWLKIDPPQKMVNRGPKTFFIPDNQGEMFGYEQDYLDYLARKENQDSLVELVGEYEKRKLLKRKNAEEQACKLKSEKEAQLEQKNEISQENKAVLDRIKQDYPKYLKYQEKLKNWCDQHYDRDELPKRYKRDIPSLSDDFDFNMHPFDYPEELKEYMKEHFLEIDKWSKFHCTQIQRDIHQDSLDLLEQSRQSFESVWIREHKSEIVQTIDAARAFNARGDCTKASKINNFCSALMDYSIAAFNGFSAGVHSRLPSTLVQAGILVGSVGLAVFVPGAKEALLFYHAFQMGRIVGESLGLCINDWREAGKQFQQMLQPIVDRINAVDDGIYGLKNSVQDFAFIGGQVSADYTMLKGAHKIIKHAKKAARLLRDQYQSSSEFIAITPDGQVFRVVDKATHDNFCQQKKADRNFGGGKNDQLNYSNGFDEGSKKIDWTSHGGKHKVKTKNLSWKEIIRGTRGKDAHAKYKPSINIERLEREGWERGTPVKNGAWRVMDWGEAIGASEGVETQYARIEMSSNTIHGHPITFEEYKRLLK